MEEEGESRIRVSCIIWVERESQVGIVVGKGGSMIRQIGIDARPAVEGVLGRKVHLDLRVKIAKEWQGDPKQLGRFGF